MNYTWVPATIDTILPHNAVIAGHDSDGSPIFVGRTYFQGDQIPCKIIPNKRAAYISHNGNEHYVGNYFEVLCGYGLRWVSSAYGGIPVGALPAGYCRTGSILYIGRAHFLGSVTPGKVNSLQRCLYVPYGGREYAIPVYEVLVNTPLINLNYKNICNLQ